MLTVMQNNISEELISYLAQTFDITREKSRALVSMADVDPRIYISGSALVGFCFREQKEVKFQPGDLDVFIHFKQGRLGRSYFCDGKPKFLMNDEYQRLIDSFTEIFGCTFEIEKEYDKAELNIPFVLASQVNPNFKLQLIFSRNPIEKVVETFDLDICCKYYHSFTLVSMKTQFLEREFRVTYNKYTPVERTKERIQKYISRGFLYNSTDEKQPRFTPEKPSVFSAEEF
jgi:hypothetical protein